MADEQVQESKRTPRGEGGVRGLFALVLLVSLILGIGAGSYVFLFQEEKDIFLVTRNNRQVAESPVPTIHMLGDFIVNMRPPDGDIYLRMDIHLAVSSRENDTDSVSREISARRSQIRDMVMTIASSKRRSDIDTIEGRETLKQEMIHAINGVLNTGRVEAVFFQEFVFQSL